MLLFEVFRSETASTNLAQEIRWYDELYCPHCHSESVINYVSYRPVYRYRHDDCGHTFNDKTSVIFTHAKIDLGTLSFIFYLLLRFNTSVRQLDAETDVSH